MDVLTWVYLVAGLGGLFIGGEMLVRGASDLAERLGIPSLIVGLSVVAFGTSSPELAVSIGAAWKGNADIAIANVVGSNIFNILLILGACAMIKPLIIQRQVIRRELPIVILSGLLLMAFSWSHSISKLESFFLFFGIIIYTVWLIREAKTSPSNLVDEKNETSISKNSPKPKSLGATTFLIIIGLVLIMIGAEALVTGAIQTAKALGVSDAVIGLTIVAAGTSLPEVVASLVATRKGKTDIAVGNVIGSNIYNVLCIVGLSGLIAPSALNVSHQILFFDLPFMLVVSFVCFVFFWTGRKLSRLEGFLFLISYAAYLAFLVQRQ